MNLPQSNDQHRTTVFRDVMRRLIRYGNALNPTAKLLQASLLSILFVTTTESHGSFAQFCKLDGVILNHPKQDENECIRFKFEVSNATEFEQQPFGRGWGNCAEHVGSTIRVSLTPPFQGSSEFRKGQLRSIWYDAMDMEIDGRMCTVVGFSAVDPNTVELE